MTSPTRIRASEAAICKALKAIDACGLSVDSLQIEGARVEIKIANVEKPKNSGNSAGLKS